MGLAFDPSGNLLLSDTQQPARARDFGGRDFHVRGNRCGGHRTRGLDAGRDAAARTARRLHRARWVSLYRRHGQSPRAGGATGRRGDDLCGNGSPGDAGDGESARTAQLNLPSACALDGSGDMFIADTANHRIREVTPAGVIETVAGSGTAGYSGDGGAASAAALYAPSGVAVDGNGNLFIADTGNHAIRLVTPDGASTPSPDKARPASRATAARASRLSSTRLRACCSMAQATCTLPIPATNRVRRLVAGRPTP